MVILEVTGSLLYPFQGPVLSKFGFFVLLEYPILLKFQQSLVLREVEKLGGSPSSLQNSFYVMNQSHMVAQPPSCLILRSVSEVERVRFLT